MPGSKPGINFQGRDGELRLLDKTQGGAGASGTPFGLRVTFEAMDLSFSPPPRVEELSREDRERLTSDAHYIPGSEMVLLDPVDVSLSAILSTGETDSIFQFIGVQWSGEEGTSKSSWQVKGTPSAGLVSTKARGLSGDGLYIGGRIDAKGSAIALPDFGDQKKVAVDMEVAWTTRAGGSRYGVRIKEVHFPPDAQRIGESADQVTVSLTGKMYGGYQRITAFSRLMDVLTSTLF